MSTDESREVQPGSERWDRSQQSVHWREIGISAVAAAARYAAATEKAPAAAKTEAQPEAEKVVTLRDIEHFAA